MGRGTDLPAHSAKPVRTTLPLGDFLPDKPPHAHPGLIACNNVIPRDGGYAPLKSFVASTNGTLPATCLGGAAFKSSSKRSFTYAGTASNIYVATISGWLSVGSGFTAGPDNMWRFEQFGDRCIASNGLDPVQSIPMTSTGVAAALKGKPPTMEILTTVRDFLVGGVIGGDALTIEWSGINNSEAWSPGTAQCDYNTFPVGGGVTGITGGEYGLVFQESRISRMTYVGGNLIFQFDEISSNVGCIARRSICRYGSLVFFLSSRGFMVCDGSSVTPIGDEKIDRTFAALGDMKNLGSMSSVVDPVNKLAIWSVPVTTGAPQQWFIYHFTLGRWTTATQSTAFLMSGLSIDYTLEDLDAFGNVDTLTDSFDAGRWKGGIAGLYVIDGNNTLGTMTGPNSAATFTYPDMEPASGRSVRIRRMRPIIDATAGLTITIAGKQRLGDALVTTTHTTLQASGDMPTRRNCRSMRVGLGVAAATPWSFAQAIDMAAEIGSGR